MTVKPEPAQADVPSFAEDLTPVAAPQGVPTTDDYRREWGCYKAVHDLTVHGSLAVTKGSAVPASHPHLRDSHEVDKNGNGGWGDGWVTSKAVELTGDYPAPDDLR